jgi:hypothetical protein
MSASNGMVSGLCSLERPALAHQSIAIPSLRGSEAKPNDMTRKSVRRQAM